MSAHKEPIEGCVQVCFREDGHLCRQDGSQTSWASLQPFPLHRVRGRQGMVPSYEGRGCVTRMLSEVGSGYLVSIGLRRKKERMEGRKRRNQGGRSTCIESGFMLLSQTS